MSDFRPQFERQSFSERYQKAVIPVMRGIEAALKTDEQLLVRCRTATGVMRVYKMQFTDEAVIIAHGLDESGNRTCLMSTSDGLELTCTIEKKDPKIDRKPIGFDLPAKEPKGKS
jgi:hypothetical protein